MNTAKTRKNASLPALLRLMLAGSLLLSVLLFSGPPTYATPPAPDASGFEVVNLPSQALTAPIEWEAPAAGAAIAGSAVAGAAKMETVLSEIASAARTSEVKALEQAETQSLRLVDDRVLVQVTTDATRADAATAAIEQAGGEVTGRANGDAWLQAWTPVTALERLSQETSIDYLRRPGEVVTMATTEGAAVINAPAWNNAGYRGTGVKVAIIDAGFKGYKSLLGTELPSSVTAKNFVDGETDAQLDTTTTEHGTACAEVVHDIAPNAAIYLAKVSYVADLQEAVTWAKANGVNIISTSLGWYNQTPGDGTGVFADLVKSARDAGIFWATAASNDRQAHWGGAFSGNADSWHQFSGTQTVDFFGPGDGNAYTIPAGYSIRAFLRWDDWTAKNQDYDLYVVRWNGSSWVIVGQGQDRQTGGAGQTPTEWVNVTTSGASAPYGIAIKRYSSNRNVNLEMFAPKVARLDKLVTARSLANLADAPLAMTVAALDVKSPYPQESYSSEGPANGLGGTAAGGATKPDIAGFANVATVSYPNNTFNGTSSATPHVAGAAALVKNAYPGWTPAQIQSYLEGRAIDMGASGKDTLYGWGRLYLGTPPQVVPPGNRKTFLPFVTKPMDAPVLNAISSSTSGSYTVSWSAVNGATSYTLQEATSSDFAGAATINAGASTSRAISGKGPGTYYYRVKGVGAWTSGNWSNVQPATVAPLSPDSIVNGSFEAGSAGWEQMSTNDPNLIINGGFPGTIVPHGGSWAVWLGGWYNDTSLIRQQVTIPASRHYLVYWHWIASADSCGYDFGGVLINNSVVADVYDLCSSMNTGGWQKHVVDLGSWAGQNVSIQIRTETDGSGNSNLFVDDVSLATSASSSAEETLSLAGLAGGAESAVRAAHGTPSGSGTIERLFGGPSGQ